MVRVKKVKGKPRTVFHNDAALVSSFDSVLDSLLQEAHHGSTNKFLYSQLAKWLRKQDVEASEKRLVSYMEFCVAFRWFLGGGRILFRDGG